MSPRALGYIDRLELTKNEVGILFDKIVEILKGFFTLQRTNSCEYNVETSYLKEGMDKLYNSSNRARPETRSKTLHSVRCQVFREGLCDAVRSPYMGIYTNLEMACNSEKERINNLITGDLRKVFAQLSANLENMRPTHNCHESRTTAKMEDTLQQLKKLKEKNLSMHNDLLVESWYGS
ncbi:uncharacterized protein K460DRAFT_140232 [Cucurbitaria berberidis CBS 394.84]|uniref:Uncharacterized protein n=1 Tax=Cucurbitaria berberidis CBS 394.84 TaxID=1168544 RepID=A0A9P4GCU2_9PLEO|nr:uncharacterized protein K460DRAFT_140232 [Cucurbitaria berberidis CBS 394.84]KAF1843149.1 hypothetical protein K460DRAFT_140232 [Cucurbitaria berberidis CBS 394.84]